MDPRKHKKEQWLSHEDFGARAKLAMAGETPGPGSSSPTATRTKWVINGGSPASPVVGSPSESTNLGIAARIGLGLAAVAVGAGFLLSKIGTADGDTDQEEPEHQKKMTAPDSEGRKISRKKFEANPKEYFKTLRRDGRNDAVNAFK